MIDDKEETIRVLFESAGVGWALGVDRGGKAPAQILAEMEDVEEELEQRIGTRPDLLAELHSDPELMRPLIESFAAAKTAPIRTMIYFILKGASVKEVKFHYLAKQQCSLVVTIRLLSGEEETFESDESWDAEVLRHFGLAKAGGRPLIDGYYTFRSRT